MTDTTHKFTEAGLGKAPFAFLGVGESAGTSCDFCGTGIRNTFHLRAADGRISKVGSECIHKHGDAGLIDIAKEAVNARRRETARAKREAAIVARLDAERARNGGLTDHEVEDAAHAARIAAEAAAKAPIIELLTPIADELEDGRGGFCDSVANDLRRGNLPTPNACAIVADILAKHAGRRTSDAYKTEAARVGAIFAAAA
jgi:hypothetical protein